jgi:hypothetical protein
VRTHLRHIYAKLDAHSRSEAVARARELGLLAPAHACADGAATNHTRCVTTAHPRGRDDRRVHIPTPQEELDMQTPTVTEISQPAYADAQKASHQTQVRRVRESLLRGREADEKRA